MSDYRRLSMSEKERRQHEELREPPVPCPYCETQVPVAGLISHIEKRCAGFRAPHPLSKWIPWSHARALGIARSTLKNWTRTKRVRWQPAGHGRLYLLRDLVKNLALIKRPAVFRAMDGDVTAFHVETNGGEQ